MCSAFFFFAVGYSTCHWCHVMERESFENEEIGKYLSDNFVCIKVDREERPDVDRVYMTFVQVRLKNRESIPFMTFDLIELNFRNIVYDICSDQAQYNDKVYMRFVQVRLTQGQVVHYRCSVQTRYKKKSACDICSGRTGLP